MANCIQINGGKSSEHRLTGECVKWCIKQLLPKYRSLDINIRFCGMEDHGCCYKLDEVGRKFKLSIKKGLSIYELISTLCHEMVHVKQYAKGELRWCNKTANRMWKKSVYNDIAYDDQPWEKEAYRLEPRMAIDFFTNCTSTL